MIFIHSFTDCGGHVKHWKLNYVIKQNMVTVNLSKYKFYNFFLILYQYDNTRL